MNYQTLNFSQYEQEISRLDMGELTSLQVKLANQLADLDRQDREFDTDKAGINRDKISCIAQRLKLLKKQGRVHRINLTIEELNVINRMRSRI